MDDVIPLDKVSHWLNCWLRDHHGRDPDRLHGPGGWSEALAELRALAEPRVTDAMIRAMVDSLLREPWRDPAVAQAKAADIRQALTASQATAARACDGQDGPHQPR